MGKSDPEAPAPAVFNPIDITGTGRDAERADINSFVRSDQDFLQRFPGLVAGRESVLGSAYSNLTGPLNSTLQNEFTNQGIAASLNSFGGGNPLASVGGTGSASRNTVAQTVAGGARDTQDYYRQAFGEQVAQNLPRAFGLSGSDAANLSIANTGNLNQVSQSNYAGSVNARNAQNAADAQNTQAAIGTAIAVAGVVAVIA